MKTLLPDSQDQDARAAHLASLEANFKVLDKNGNGVLDRDEFEAMIIAYFEEKGV
eukprot:CAMPEP_0170556624 /NCGR_PEP_ID=MMETSP0211-20121228/17817_1 /TAXON_ID=311385 /ORGANISM="Pseudokeronopsis sp., Strain OXSARD2" /LENGTH=54 /DNA_ID=CAMNT_0010867077 /DNA_START=61 /DNA_END=225 /DNA_ORIENTATION=+